jgi:uncharacterized protein
LATGTSIATPDTPAASPGAKSSRSRRWLKKILKIAVCTYVGLAIVLYSLQTWMIFPGHSTQGTPAAAVRPARDQELVMLPTSSGEKIALLFAPAQRPGGSPHPQAASRPTLLYFYGNAMSLSGCYGELQHFRRLGCNVAIAEFVGYGLSTGKPSEAGIYATAEAAYDYLLTRADVDRRQIIPVGWSLGAAAAIDLASRKPVAAVATFSAFTNMGEMGRKLLPWFPTSLLLKHRFENERKMANVSVPCFLAHGTGDSLVPFAMNAKLAAAARGAVTVVPVSGGDHNDIFELGGTALMRKFGEFVESVHQGAAPGP